ncbi:tetratricopeptide repeat protein [Polynucleobacter sp. MWH-S4W17]|uniref:tetratricopeptide repeat protein n=1 Tax=Polynucleobacter sp. MWH-S4W17 TaxID=1855910 RepID=UPI001BFE3869|nr:tetratricopeptide repeat protein [Polynucleobacter sp. MWH-S4W17]QWD81746.1 glycosyltransferase family protein [Polynucleobacter sp. MWH-S4W17]
MNYEAQILFKNSIRHIHEGQLDHAKILLVKARNLDKANSEIIRLLSVIAALEYDFINALALIDESIELSPTNGVAYSNRGNILKELFRHEEAIIALDKAISLAPDYAEAYNNKGNALQELHRYEEALLWYDNAIRLQPDYAEAYSNKGNALGLLNRYGEAMEHYDKSTAISPQYIDAYWHKALSQLPNGDFQNGWQNYESRWFKSNPVSLRFADIPRLESLSNIAGKEILIWAEQGLGDSLQFCRYIQPLSELGAHVTFLVPQPLLGCFKSLRAHCHLVDNLEMPLIKFNYQSPLLSLPLVFGTTLGSIPCEIPYLNYEQSKKEAFEKLLPNAGNLKVGVIWNGGFRTGAPMLWGVNKRRNIELDQFVALKDVPGVEFISLQKGDPAESELAARKDQVWPELINCVHLLNDFADTAALMGCLDLIISVDTSSAHLAGALGKPVWILNRYDSCWRWLRGREDSPWYPTAKIYQQKQPGNWDDVIARVRLDLNDLAQKRSTEL